MAINWTGLKCCPMCFLDKYPKARKKFLSVDIKEWDEDDYILEQLIAEILVYGYK